MKNYLPFFMLMWAVFDANANTDLRCTNNLLRKCSCGIVVYDYRPQYTVNCTNTGFQNTSALESLPEETQVLIFTGNSIPKLPWNVFGALSKLQNLRVIDMTNNEIVDIRGKSYHHVTNVERLILNHNNLRISSEDIDSDHHHPRVFSNFINLLELHLTNAFADNTTEALSNDLHDIFVTSGLNLLQKLHLEQNEIRTFGDKAVFCGVPNLRDLHLGDNLLTEINFNITCLKHLRFIDLERNKFKTFLPRDLKLLDKVVAAHRLTDRNATLLIDIRMKSLVCDKLSYFTKWMRETNVSVRNKEALRCSTSRGKIVPVFVLQSETNLAENSTTKRLLIGITSISIVALVCTLVYLYRKQSTGSQRIFDMLGRNVQYTTIEPQPEHV